MKSIHQAPQSTFRWWGRRSLNAFDHLSTVLNQLGFEGPATWSEGPLVPYSIGLTPAIKARLSLSAVGSQNDCALFDCGLILFSRTLYERAVIADPDKAISRQSVFAGFLPCLKISLSHLKWCSEVSDNNPLWTMELDDTAAASGVHTFILDLQNFLLPLLAGLTSDAELLSLMKACLLKKKPLWVKSDPPYFVRLPQLVELLESPYA